MSEKSIQEYNLTILEVVPLGELELSAERRHQPVDA